MNREKSKKINEFIINNPDITYEKIGEKFNLKKCAISARARRLKVKRNNKRSEKDIQFLKEHWPNSDIEIILKYFNLKNNRKDLSILYNLAKYYKIKRNILGEDVRRKTDLSFLLNNDLESFYWIGYILADGYLDNYMLTISSIDKFHLVKFANKINKKIQKIKITKNYYQQKLENNHNYKQMYSVYGYHKSVLEKLIQKFDIKPQKTYNPPNFEKWNFTNDQLIALFIGFIDGDGHIKFDKKNRVLGLEIENHASWVYFHNFIAKVLNKNINKNKPNKARINKRGYSKIYLNSKHVDFLGQFIKKNNLPFLERKWEKYLY